MDRHLPDRSQEVHRFFCHNLSVIHFVLTSVYRLWDEEAIGLEENLQTWFGRFTRRGGIDQIPVKSLRLPLLTSTCRAGLTLQICKLDGKLCQDSALKEILARDPDAVAVELESKIELGLIKVEDETG